MDNANAAGTVRKLNILVVSDHESEFIWDFFDRSVFDKVELIVSCGDLKPEYLSFLVTMLPVPLLYVPGNHDERYEKDPPEGCINLEEKGVFTYKDIRFLGFGGCMSGVDMPNQYTEREMTRRVRRQGFSVRLAGGFDVLVTHVAARGLGDGEDTFHRGFVCYRDLIDRWHPAYHLHGHQHPCYSHSAKQSEIYGSTRIINGYNYRLMTLEVPGRSASAHGLFLGKRQEDRKS